jgi:hypothetical protein
MAPGFLTAAAKAVHEAWTKPGSLTLVVSPSARQSGEFVRKPGRSCGVWVCELKETGTTRFR